MGEAGSSSPEVFDSLCFAEAAELLGALLRLAAATDQRPRRQPELVARLCREVDAEHQDYDCQTLAEP